MALRYWVILERQDQIEERNRFLERQTFNLREDRWIELYRAQVMGEMAKLRADTGVEDKEAFDGILADGEEIPITDPDMLEEWFQQMSQRQFMTGAQDPTPGIGGTIRGDWV